MAVSAAGKANGEPGEWAGEVIPLEELTALLARFGMIVGLDTSPEALDVGDLEDRPEGMAILLRRSKVDQEARGRRKVRSTARCPPPAR